MKNILDILKNNASLIIETVSDWGFDNVRVYLANAPFEKNLLNLLVDKMNSESPVLESERPFPYTK